MGPGDKNYKDKATVGGITMSVGFDNDYRCYTIYFPQIQIGKDPKVFDQVIRISETPGSAKYAFNFAKDKAEELRDPYKVFVELEKAKYAGEFESEDDSHEEEEGGWDGEE